MIFSRRIQVKIIVRVTAVQNKLEGTFKIGIRPQIGLRLQAEDRLKALG
jgi:hypothetical protein